MKNKTLQYLASIEAENQREIEEGAKELARQEADDLCHVPNAVSLIFEEEIRGVYPKFFSHAPRAVCEALGATGFREDEENLGHDPVILKAKWPEYIWSLGAALSAKWPNGQWLYQPRDVTALRKAVDLFRAGELVEAWGVIAEHDGVPEAEMPRSMLEQMKTSGVFGQSLF